MKRWVIIFSRLRAHWQLKCTKYKICCVCCTVEKYAHSTFRGCWGLFLQVKRHCVVSHVVRERLSFIADAYLTFPVNQNHVNITTHTHTNFAGTQPKPAWREILRFSFEQPASGWVCSDGSQFFSHTLGSEYSNNSQLVLWTSVIHRVCVHVAISAQRCTGKPGFNHWESFWTYAEQMSLF